MPIPENVLSELKQEHGDLVVVETPDGTLGFRRPKLAEYQRFTDKVGSQKTSAGAREICTACVVYPAKDEAKSVLDKYPAVSFTVAEGLNRLAGGEFEVEISKG